MTLEDTRTGNVNARGLADWEVVAVQRTLEDIRMGNVVCDMQVASLVNYTVLTSPLRGLKTACWSMWILLARP